MYPKLKLVCITNVGFRGRAWDGYRGGSGDEWEMAERLMGEETGIK